MAMIPNQTVKICGLNSSVITWT